MYWVAAAEIGFLEVAQVSDVGQAALPFGITMAEPGVAELTPQIDRDRANYPGLPPVWSPSQPSCLDVQQDRVVL